MPYIYGTLMEEKKRLEEILKNYEDELNSLHIKGSIVEKEIKGHRYKYLVYREGKKVKTVYLKRNNVHDMEKILTKRKEFLNAIKSIKDDLKVIRKVIKDE